MELTPFDHYTPRLALAKLQCPLPQTNHVLRQRLIDLLVNKERHTKVILVHAPAGYGKSVLLSQYLQYRQAQGMQTLWLSLDSADNDLDRLVRHLHASWAALKPELSATDTSISANWLEPFANPSAPYILFLDEFETISNSTVLRYIQQLIEYLPLDCEIVIGSRHMPDLGIGRLRSRHQVLEINQRHMCFSLAETRDFLVQHHALSLRDQDLSLLINRTEGWITAIHLAVLALNDHHDVGRYFATFSGSHAELAQFLAEDILRKLNQSHRNFLLHTSILGELNDAVCNYIRQDNDSANHLRFLSQKNLFLIPLDQNHSRFRYHGLFSSYLLDCLKATQPDTYIELNRRAASWYLEHDRPLLAIDHLLNTADQHEAIALLKQHAKSLLIEGRVRRLLRWFDRLSPNLLKPEYELKLIFGWALVLNRRYAEAQTLLNEYLFNPSATISAELIQQAHTLECLQLSMTDQIAACHPKSEHQLAAIEPTQLLQYGVLISIVAYCLIAAGKYEDARRTMAQALHQDLGLQATFIRPLCDALEGWIDLIQGRLNHAASRLERSYQRVWLNDEKSIPGGKAVIGVPYAELLYERNELERAQGVLGECLAFARENGTVDSLISAYIMQSRIARALGNTDAAQRYLQELEETGTEVGLKRVILSVKLENVRLHWLAGDIPAAQALLLQIIQMQSLDHSPGYSWPAQDVDSVDMMRWRLMIATGQSTQAEVELKQAFKAATASQRHRRSLKIRILTASALMASGKVNAAMRAFTEALTIASEDGFVRTFLDEGRDIENLLQLWAQKHRQHPEKLQLSENFSQQLFGESLNSTTTKAHAQAAPSQTVSQPLSQPLTKRELEILTHLAKGSRTRVIAEALFVSEVTVKAHLRNINSKLGAHGRVEAVAIARDLQII